MDTLDTEEVEQAGLSKKKGFSFRDLCIVVRIFFWYI